MVAGPVQLPAQPAGRQPGLLQPRLRQQSAQRWGAGPFQVQKFDRRTASSSSSATRDGGAARQAGHPDVPHLGGLASLNAFRNGQIDAVGVGSRDRLAQVQGQPGIEIRKGPSLQLDYFTLNGQSPNLADLQVRKAVFEAIDREQILKFHFNGLNYTADPQDSMLLLPFQKGYTDNVSKAIRFDPEQAKKDLDAAGWTVGPEARSAGGTAAQAEDRRALRADRAFPGGAREAARVKDLPGQRQYPDGAQRPVPVHRARQGQAGRGRGQPGVFCRSRATRPWPLS